MIEEMRAMARWLRSDKAPEVTDGPGIPKMLDSGADEIERLTAEVRKLKDVLNELRNRRGKSVLGKQCADSSQSDDWKAQEQLKNDKRLLDYLAAEKDHDHNRAIFRRNMPITRGAISAAQYEFPQLTEADSDSNQEDDGALDPYDAVAPYRCTYCSGTLLGDNIEYQKLMYCGVGCAYISAASEGQSAQTSRCQHYDYQWNHDPEKGTATCTNCKETWPENSVPERRGHWACPACARVNSPTRKLCFNGCGRD